VAKTSAMESACWHKWENCGLMEGEGLVDANGFAGFSGFTAMEGNQLASWV